MMDILPEDTIIKPCIICGEPTLAHHHVYRQDKRNRELLRWLIDLPFNKEYICPGCHTSHGSEGIPRMNQSEFFKELRKWLLAQGIRKPK